MSPILAKKEFDYIVVGSGPAGAVIAKTLTDNKKNLCTHP